MQNNFLVYKLRFENFPFSCIGKDVFIEKENSKRRFQTDVSYNAYRALEKYSVQWELLQTDVDSDIAHEITMDIFRRSTDQKLKLAKRNAARIEMIKKIFAPGYKEYISDPNNIKYEL